MVFTFFNNWKAQLFVERYLPKVPNAFKNNNIFDLHTYNYLSTLEIIICKIKWKQVMSNIINVHF